MTASTDSEQRTIARGSVSRGPLRQYWYALVTAVQFLTRIPISSELPSSESLRIAPLFFPFIGCIVGCITAGFIALAGFVWPVWICVLLALSAEVLLTGALHEDGLADFCDGFGGGWKRDDVLRILKDSRIGTYGTVGLVLAISLRATCIVTLVERYGTEHWLHWVSAIVAAAALARWTIVLTMVVVPPIAERESLSKDVAYRISWKLCLSSGIGALPAILVFAYLLPIHTIVSLGLMSLAWLVLVRLIRRKLQGVTGDCLGCIGYITQLMFLLGASARIS